MSLILAHIHSFMNDHSPITTQGLQLSLKTKNYVLLQHIHKNPYIEGCFYKIKQYTYNCIDYNTSHNMCR